MTANKNKQLNIQGKNPVVDQGAELHPPAITQVFAVRAGV